jgi:putative aminopeptidase FrvX
MRDFDIQATLQSLIEAYGPVGVEDEVRSLCRKLLTPLSDNITEDPAGNLIAHFKGQDSDPAKSIRIFVHMDELSLIVKRINENGQIRVDPLGGFHPLFWGQGMVDILGNKKTIPAVLSHGCMHTTRESKNINKIKPTDYRGEGKSAQWDDVFVFTGKDNEELEKAGIGPGTRVVLPKSRRKIQYFGDFLGSFFIDNRAAITVAISALTQLQKQDKQPNHDVYLVTTTHEEVGGYGASYAARTLPGNLSIAVDVGPVAEEYQTKLTPDPIIVYHDGYGTYDKKTCDHIASLASNLKIPTQKALFGSYGSDASITQHYGLSAKSVLLAIPTENTHGFEIIHKDGIESCANLLAAFLCQKT